MELSRNLRIESVARLEPTAPRRVDVRQSVRAAVDLMRAERVGCVLVTDEGRLVGIFTERDLLTRVLAVDRPLTTPMSGCMTPDPESVDRNDPIRVAILKMERGGFRHLPVVDSHRRPVGILSAKRVIGWVVSHFPHIVHNLPPHAEQAAAREREGA